MAALLAAFQCFPLHHAAAGPGDGQTPQQVPAQEVPWPTSGWPVSTPEDQGMDSASLARLIENVGDCDRGEAFPEDFRGTREQDSNV
jgi:hypothetical protein